MQTGEAPPEPAGASEIPDSASGPEATGSDPRERLHRWGQHALIWLGPLIAAMVFVGLLNVPTVVQEKYWLTIIALVVPVGAAWFVSRRSDRAVEFGASLAALYTPFLVMVVLLGTRWYLAGMAGDQTYRIEYLTRFVHSPLLHDYTYANKPAFYSPGWFWIAGQVGHLTDTQGWAMYKPAAIFSLWLAGVLAFCAWRVTVGPRRAALFTAVTCIALPSAPAAWFGLESFLNGAIYEPYGWIVLAPLPAVICWFARAHGPFQWRRTIFLGLALGAAAWFFLDYGALAAVAILGLAATTPGAERRERLKEAGGTFAIAFATTIPWSVPFAIAWLADGRPTAMSTTFFNDGSFGSLSLSLSATPALAVAIFGVIALIAGFPRGPVTRGLRVLGVTLAGAAIVQAWLGRGGRGVLFHRLTPAIDVVALVAGAQMFAAIWVLTKGRLRQLIDRPRNLVFGGLAVVLVVAAAGHAVEILTAGMTHAAKNEVYYNGQMPRAADDRTFHQENVQGAQSQIAQLTGVTDPQKLRVLTSSQALLAEVPYDGYLQWWELYSNPLANFRDREAKLTTLAAITNPQAMIAALKADPSLPNVFYLNQTSDGKWTFTAQTFDPKSAGVGTFTAAFSPSAFDDPCFAKAPNFAWEIVAVKC